MTSTAANSRLVTHIQSIPIRSILGSLGSASIGQLLLVVTGVLAARALGPEDRGHFALLVLIPGAAALICALAVPSALTYEIAKDPAGARDVLRVSIPVITVQILVAMLISAVGLWFLYSNESNRWLAVLFVPTAALSILQSYALASLQGMKSFVRFNSLRLLPQACYTVLILSVIALGHRSLEAIAVAFVVSFVFSAAVILFVAAIDLPPKSLSPSVGAAVSARQMLRWGARGFLGTSSPAQALRIDQMAIGMALKPADLGMYVAATAFTNLPRFIAQSVGMIAYPTIASTDRSEQPSMTKRFFLLTALLAGLVAGSVWLLAGWLVPLMFGADFESSVPVVRILIVAAFVTALRMILSDCYRAEGSPGLGSVAELAYWIALVVLLPIGIQQRGLEGAALGIVLSSCVGFGVLLLARRQNVKLSLPFFALPRVTLTPTRKIALSVVGLSLLAGLLVSRFQTVWWLMLPALLGGVAGASAVRNALPSYDRGPVTGLHTTEEARSETQADVLITRVARLVFYAGVSTVTLLMVRFLPASTLSDALFLASLAFALLAAVVTRQAFSFWLPPGMAWGLAIFSAGAVVSAMGAVQPIASLTYVARFLIVATVWCWLGIAVLKTPKHVSNVLVAWGVAGALTGTAAVIQAVYGDVIPNTSPTWGRMTGFAQHVNDLGGSAATAGVACLALFGASGSRRVRILSILLFLMSSLGVLMSGSLGGLLGLLAGTLLWVLLGRTSLRSLSKPAGGALAMLLIGSFALGKLAGSVYSPLQRLRDTTDSDRELGCSTCSRIETYQEGIRVFLARPLTGTGFDGESSVLSNGLAIHNLLLQPAMQGGVLALIGICLILLSIARLLMVGIANARSVAEWQLWRGFAAIFACFLVFSMTAPILFTRFGWLFLPIAAGLRCQQMSASSIEERGIWSGPTKLWSRSHKLVKSGA